MSQSQHIEMFAALAAPFSDEEVRSRRQGGRDVQYITARVVMNRLDEVVGPENWWDDYTPIENAVVCRLTLQLPDGTTLTKCDAGGFSETVDAGDYEKSGFSDAFKRAAVKFGIGRYLYGDGVPTSIRGLLAREAAPRRREVRADAAEVQPQAQAPAQPQPQPQYQPQSQSQGPRSAAAPKSGKALFAWVKERDEKLGCDLLRSLSEWGKSQDYPARMVQWNGDQVDRAHLEAVRRLGALELTPQR